MKQFTVILAIAASAITLPALGARDSEARPSPDYSKQALLFDMSRGNGLGSDFYAPGPRQITIPRFGRIAFLLLAPYVGVTGATAASPKPAVDPFALTPMSAAYTPKTFRDRWTEWKLRRQLGEANR